MSDNLMAALAHRILGGKENSQQDMENGIQRPNNAVHSQLQAHADYGGRHDFGTDERLIIFRHLTGITSHPSMVQSQLSPGGRAAPNLGIYARVIKNEANAKRGYKNFSWLINGCLGLQVIVAASLTALGAADASHSAITALGAINTVVAGLLTFLKGSGLPNRLTYYHTEWKQIREFIEQRERDFSRPGCDLDVHGVVRMIETMYEEVKKDMEASTPDRFAGFGMSRKQVENASKDAGFHLPRTEAGGLGEKFKDIQSGFGDEGLEEKPAEFDSTLGNKAQEWLKGKFKEPESGLAENPPSRDWTNIKFNDFEHCNNHLAFEHQIATSSTIRPKYILTEIFTDLLFTPYSPGGLETSGDRPRMRYCSNENTKSKWPWSTQDEAATRTIDILLHSDSVQAGKGGFFKICSGVTTIEELAAVHEKVFGVKVDVTREGSVDDLEKELASLRKQKGRTGYGEYMSEAAALIASKGLWGNTDVTEMDQFEKSATLEEYFIEVKNKA